MQADVGDMEKPAQREGRGRSGVETGGVGQSGAKLRAPGLSKWILLKWKFPPIPEMSLAVRPGLVGLRLLGTQAGHKPNNLYPSQSCHPRWAHHSPHTSSRPSHFLPQPPRALVHPRPTLHSPPPLLAGPAPPALLSPPVLSSLCLFILHLHPLSFLTPLIPTSLCSLTQSPQLLTLYIIFCSLLLFLTPPHLLHFSCLPLPTHPHTLPSFFSPLPFHLLEPSPTPDIPSPLTFLLQTFHTACPSPTCPLSPILIHDPRANSPSLTRTLLFFLSRGHAWSLSVHDLTLGAAGGAVNVLVKGQDSCTVLSCLAF